MKKRIAVLGAGPMGLAVAYQLCKDGYEPIIFEADDRVGGMSASFDFEGLSIERYYHFHCTTDTAFFQILEELNIKDKLHWVKTKMAYWYKDRLQSWGNPIALLQFRHLALVPKLRYALHAFFSMKRKDWEKLDCISATKWIQKWVGKKAYKTLWEPLFLYKFYEYSNLISAAWAWHRIYRLGHSRYNLFQEKLGYLEGGSQTLLHSMQAFIESQGAKINLKSPVSKVNIKENKVKGIEVNGKLLGFDHVISTIPLPLIPQIIPDLPKDTLSKIKNLKNIAVVCVIAKLKKFVSNAFWTNINDPNMDIPGLIEYTNLNPLDKKNHIVYVPFYMPYTNPKFSEANESFLNKVKQYIKKMNPKIKDEDFISLHASRYRYSQPICEIKHLHKLPPIQSSISNLYIADTSFYYPKDRGISDSIEFGRMLGKLIKK